MSDETNFSNVLLATTLILDRDFAAWELWDALCLQYPRLRRYFPDGFASLPCRIWISNELEGMRREKLAIRDGSGLHRLTRKGIKQRRAMAKMN